MPFSETAKIRSYIWNYIKDGYGLDLGCEYDKIHPRCLGIDRVETPAVNIVGDISKIPSIKDETFDWVYSSHSIEDIHDTKNALIEWLRVLKNDGYLILYFPYKFYYPNIGHPLANPNHVHDFVPSDVVKILREIKDDIWIVTSEIRGHPRQNEFHEYSCLIIAKKNKPQKPKIFIDNNHQIGDTLSVTHLCSLLKSEFVDCHITLKQDFSNVVERFLVDKIGSEEVPYDMIVLQDPYRTELGAYLRRVSHFSQYTARVCKEIYPKLPIYQRIDQPVPLTYNITNFDYNHNISLPEKFVAVAMETFPPRQWTDDKWNELFEYFKQKSIYIVLLGKEIPNKFVLDNVIDLRGETSFRKSIAILSKCDLVISVDTSFVHFSHILNKKCIVLCGPSHHATTLYPTSIPIYREDKQCVCCYNWTSSEEIKWADSLPVLYDNGSHFTGQEMRIHVQKDCENYMQGTQCMKAITVDQVIKAFENV